MARNNDQTSNDILAKQLRDNWVQFTCTGAIVIGGIVYLSGNIPKFFASRPKLLGRMASLVIVCKGVGYYITHRNPIEKLKQPKFPEDGELVDRLQRFVKYLIGIAFAANQCLLTMYLRTILNSLISVFNRLIEEEKIYLREKGNKGFFSKQPERKILSAITEVSEALELTFPAFLKVNKTLCLIICSFLFGVIEVDEFFRCRRQIKPSNAVQIKPSDAVQIKPSYAVQIKPSDAVQIKPSDAVQIKPSDAVQIKTSDGVDSC